MRVIRSWPRCFYNYSANWEFPRDFVKRCGWSKKLEKGGLMKISRVQLSNFESNCIDQYHGKTLN